MTENELQKVGEQVVKQNKNRDERGVRKQEYKRFKKDVDYLPIDSNEMVTILEFSKLVSKRNGRPPAFESKEELQEAIEGYWDYLIKANKGGNALIPDVEGLGTFIGVCRDTLNEWERSNYKGFSDAVKSAKNAIAACKKQLALHGKIPPIVFATDFNNNHGYTQKQEVVLTPTNPLGEQKDIEEIRQTYIDSVSIDDSDE